MLARMCLKPCFLPGAILIPSDGGWRTGYHEPAPTNVSSNIELWGPGGGERRQPGKREGVKLATAILVQYLFPPPLLVGAVATNVVNEYACLQTGLRIGGRLSPRRPSRAAGEAVGLAG